MKTYIFLTLLIASTNGFGVLPNFHSRRHFSIDFALNADATIDSPEAAIEVNPKEAVKLFGRLAEKYIMLDSSGGMCCYSACSDCEYRLPGGGYRMADQSAARPKWIPIYENRHFESQGKEHTTKWSSEIFDDGPVVTKDEFVSAVTALDFAPPLGGPYVGASSAKIEDTALAERLFDILVEDTTKDKLTRHRMHLSLKKLANGEEGLTWAMFLKTLTGN